MNTHTTIREKFVQVTGLLRESSDWNTGKMIMNRLPHLKRHILEFELYFYTIGNYLVPFLGQINGMMKMALNGKSLDGFE